MFDIRQTQFGKEKINLNAFILKKKKKKQQQKRNDFDFIKQKNTNRNSILIHSNLQYARSLDIYSRSRNICTLYTPV